jgi:Na+/H+-dicarboxylate symporter
MLMKIKLYWQVLIAMVLGIAFALIFKEQALIAKPLGTIFMRLLRMIIVPLIIFSWILLTYIAFSDSNWTHTSKFNKTRSWN